MTDPAGEAAAGASLWRELRGARVFVTGGTGFFGSWLLETLLTADRAFGLGVEVSVLTRSAARFRRAHPALAAGPGVALLEGDVRSFPTPRRDFSHVIHAAGDPLPAGQEPAEVFATLAGGTEHVLAFARACGAKRLLCVSSGAVYGAQPPDLPLMPEDHPVPRWDSDHRSPAEAYACGKRRAEALCQEAAARTTLRVPIARGFAFIGPRMPMRGGFAAADFIRDAVDGRAITVAGDGTPVRSYLYAADMAVWLWTILLRGESGRAYNAGSEEPVSIAELAREVRAEVDPDAEIRVLRAPVPGAAASRYVPDTRRAREELGLRETVGRAEAIRRTAQWLRSAR